MLISGLFWILLVNHNLWALRGNKRNRNRYIIDNYILLHDSQWWHLLCHRCTFHFYLLSLSTAAEDQRRSLSFRRRRCLWREKTETATRKRGSLSAERTLFKADGSRPASEKTRSCFFFFFLILIGLWLLLGRFLLFNCKHPRLSPLCLQCRLSLCVLAQSLLCDILSGLQFVMEACRWRTLQLNSILERVKLQQSPPPPQLFQVHFPAEASQPFISSAAALMLCCERTCLSFVPVLIPFVLITRLTALQPLPGWRVN